MDSTGLKPLSRHNESGCPFTEGSVRRQMERVLSSPEFKATPAQRSFLTFVVEKVLAGQSADIKGYTVATEVFGRGEDFDQATDPIVSIHANKLRRALERYYLIAGPQDPIRIEIPKGTYVPVFRRQASLDPVSDESGAPSNVLSSGNSFASYNPIPLKKARSALSGNCSSPLPVISSSSSLRLDAFASKAACIYNS